MLRQRLRTAVAAAVARRPMWTPQRALASTGSSAPRLQLTHAESDLFDFLLYVQHLHAPRTTLRVAGGWVRDKLRGASGGDVDVALDNLSGRDFAAHIVAFQRARRLPLSSIGVVKANSDKSKHLEVATVAIEGQSVDFVHLRAESYSSDSRIPQTTFAKPLEDALRRDITINALFYNLNTQEVEDWTGQGLADLAAGVIRTPLEPVQTFLDDPLRVLRAVRFACEFGFRLDGKLSQAVLEHAEIKDAMVRKVSRERVGIEVRKMLSGKDPSRAFSLLAAFGLLDLVFNDLSVARDADVDAATSAAPPSPMSSLSFPPRLWSKALEAEALAHLRFLQQSRLALANHQISFVEATGAVLAPLFLSASAVAAIAGPPAPAPSLESADEHLVVESSLGYLRERDAATREVRTDEIVEVLKTNVKWPKPAAKRVALIVEAVAAYPARATFGSSGDTALGDRLKLFMWMTRYNSVLAPALSILLTNYAGDSRDDAGAAAARLSTLQAFLELGAGYDEQGKGRRRRADGSVIRAQLGVTAGPKIARALEVLAVWEMVHPSASLDEELAFLQRLAPRLEE
ncbi:hypothetical protein PybrP1_010185 [[Pythium] brassicae (nom. inval.)]|nr:hypothetical protein PybrP1_010185 [[Pythium] brassicae (nom. inval.)]